jgi:hypothetical protein
MPWGVRKEGNKWAIYRKDTGKTVGHSTSKAKAEGSVRARYWGAAKSGEKLSCPVTNMLEFVRAVALSVELNEAESDIVIIDGKEYERVPDSIKENMSGGFAAATGFRIRDGKGYVPKGKLKAVKQLDKDITLEVG